MSMIVLSLPAVVCMCVFAQDVLLEFAGPSLRMLRELQELAMAEGRRTQRRTADGAELHRLDKDDEISGNEFMAQMLAKLDANEEDRHIKRGKHVRDAITGVLKEMGETTWESKSGGGGDGASAQRMRRSSLMNDADVGDLRSIVVEPGSTGHSNARTSTVLWRV